MLSQCDNLLLMRMNSEADLGHLSDAFSFVPDSLIQRATTFRQGESLVAGKVVSHPTYVRFGQRSRRKAAPTSRPPGPPRSDRALNARRLERRILRPPHCLVHLLHQVVQRRLRQASFSAAAATARATAAETIRRLVTGGSRLVPAVPSDSAATACARR